MKGLQMCVGWKPSCGLAEFPEPRGKGLKLAE